VTEKKTQSKSGKVNNKKEISSMAKANNPAKKAPTKVTASNDATTVKTGQTISDSAKKKPVPVKAKAPAKKAVNKAAASKAAAAAKTVETKGSSAQKKPAAKTAKTPVVKVSDNTKKAKSAFAKKMDEVKSTAVVIGHIIAAAAKNANKKEESLESAIASSLHEMKKDVHRAAEKIVEKTKE
jgi:hypothetical protein